MHKRVPLCIYAIFFIFYGFNVFLVLTFKNGCLVFLQVQEMEEKLNKLRNGVILVKPEDKKIIEESFSEKVNQWRKRKRMFKELWDNITENSPKDQKEFKVLMHFFLLHLPALSS